MIENVAGSVEETSDIGKLEIDELIVLVANYGQLIEIVVVFAEWRRQMTLTS